MNVYTHKHKIYCSCIKLKIRTSHITIIVVKSNTKSL